MGGGGHGHICILKATLHTSNCMIHLFITSPYMSISKNNSKQRSHTRATLLLLVINSCVCRNLLFN